MIFYDKETTHQQAIRVERSGNRKPRPFKFREVEGNLEFDSVDETHLDVLY